MNKNVFKLIIIIAIAGVVLFLYINKQTKVNTLNENVYVNDESNVPIVLDETEINQPFSDKTSSVSDCEWLEDMDVVVQIVFPEGYDIASGYTFNFRYNPTPDSLTYNLGRIARDTCDYKTGFYSNELASINDAFVEIWGDSPQDVLPLKNGSVEVSFSNGKPNFDGILTVEIAEQ